MEYEGTLRIKWDPNYPKAPHGYIVMYAPYKGWSRMPPVRRLNNEDELRSFLANVRLDSLVVESATKVLLLVNQHDVPNVRLTETKITELFPT